MKTNRRKFLDPKRSVPFAMESLRESLWAGEEVVLARARHAIARRGPRKEFLFGGNFFGYPQQGKAYAEKFAALFNFATRPLYWRGFEPEEGKPLFAQVDTRLARLEKSGLTAKGHPLCWFHEAGSDAGGHFWPHGGFLRPDGQPKESYDRLRRLIRAWTRT